MRVRFRACCGVGAGLDQQARDIRPAVNNGCVQERNAVVVSLIDCETGFQKNRERIRIIEGRSAMALVEASRMRSGAKLFYQITVGLAAQLSHRFQMKCSREKVH